MRRPIRNVRVSENFVPVSEFKAKTAEWLRKAGDTGAPVIVTQNGKPAGVLLSPEVFDELTEQARFVAAVAKWNGTQWSALGSGMNSLVSALTVFEDGAGPALYAGGAFTTAGTRASNSIAAWHCL